MLREVFWNILEISVSVGIVVAVLLLCSRRLNQRYATKWKYWLWLALAVRLAIPVNPGLPAGLLSTSEQQIGEEKLSTGDVADSGGAEPDVTWIFPPVSGFAGLQLCGRVICSLRGFLL